MCICLTCDCCKAVCDCKAGDADCTDLILALAIPPIGVLRKRGPKREFWVSICLTMALFVPGTIYAVTIVTTKENKGTK